MTTTESVKRARVLSKLKTNVQHAAYFITSMQTFKAAETVPAASDASQRGPITLKDHCKNVLRKLKHPAPPESSVKSSARSVVSSMEDPEPIVFAPTRVSRVPTLNALSLDNDQPLTMEPVETPAAKEQNGTQVKTAAAVVSPIQPQNGFRPSSTNRRLSSDPTQRFHQIAQQLKAHTSSFDLSKIGSDSGSVSISSDGNSAKLGNGIAGDRRSSSVVL
ncbi:hypothetical protein K440DRAFT_616965 [Wilcoxina mikolae CBS 423.85]|nr:hypothetical protein K440DRAFT_616965 [Wilcoxina mikolae CBS 423.85]